MYVLYYNKSENTFYNYELEANDIHFMQKYFILLIYDATRENEAIV